MKQSIFEIAADLFPYIGYGTMLFILAVSLYLIGDATDKFRQRKKPGHPSVMRSSIVRIRLLTLARDNAPLLGLAFTVAGMMLGLKNSGQDLWTVLPAAMGTTLIGAITVVVSNIGLSIHSWIDGDPAQKATPPKTSRILPFIPKTADDHD
ncbi:hypothetical protein [Litorimonas sp. WD9-15]|uniref:hypothetical protein n=1 Tax=Litorimonas sp. WD9-15 TaxID=3418716 RepID=UPI003D0929CC